MIKALAQGAEKEARKAVEKTKALVRAFVGLALPRFDGRVVGKCIEAWAF